MPPEKRPIAEGEVRFEPLAMPRILPKFSVSRTTIWLVSDQSIWRMQMALSMMRGMMWCGSPVRLCFDYRGFGWVCHMYVLYLYVC